MVEVERVILEFIVEKVINNKKNVKWYPMLNQISFSVIDEGDYRTGRKSSSSYCWVQLVRGNAMSSHPVIESSDSKIFFLI